MKVKQETTGDRIKISRTLSGLTQGELGALVGVSATAIMRYERGEREPKVQTFRAIAKALNVSEDYLLLQTDESAPASDSSAKAFEMAWNEYLSGQAGIDIEKIINRASYIRSTETSAKIEIKSNEEILASIKEKLKEHFDIVKAICFDPSVIPEAYPERISEVTEYLKAGSDYLKLKLPGPHILPDDIEQAKRIRETKSSHRGE